MKKTMQVIGTSLALALPAAAGERATESFRAEHAEVREHLSHLEAMVGSMGTADAAGRKKTAGFVVKFLKEHLLEHAKWEEERLYRAVDQRTHGAPHAFTATMRHEHVIVGRWVGELATMAAAAEVDATAFARKADRLLGLVAAHFEEEEDVLLPILDKSTTRAELEKELGMGVHAH